jgi:glycosyltransferase involved in cell wall biosynthesis
MKIGIIIGRIGDIDGVSLETEKWIKVLKKMGHDIYILSGKFAGHVVDREKETVLPQLSFFSPNCEWEQKRAFFYPDDDPDELLEHLEYSSDVLAIQIFKWVIANKIETILAQNASALPCHLSMGMGIKKFVQHTGMHVVCHDHDFYWERGTRYATPHKEIEEIVKTTFPLQFPHVRHAVINSYAKETLMHRFNIDSTVVPNVMDFKKPYGKVDNYNRNLLKDINLEQDDIPLFQVTRIVERKGIETAIELIERLKDKKVKLVITGSRADDERFGYYKKLINIIKKKKIEDRVIFGNKRILTERNNAKKGEKIYSISDAYAHAVACTYFSSWEGFGNAFIECILAKKPIFVNNYQPIYWPELGSKGFETVMIEDNMLTDEAVEQIKEIIYNPKRCKEIGEYNYEIGKKHFSYKVLERKLSKIFDF